MSYLRSGRGKMLSSAGHGRQLRRDFRIMAAVKFEVITNPEKSVDAVDALEVVRECHGGPDFADAVGAFCSIALDEGWFPLAINAALEPFDVKMEPK